MQNFKTTTIINIAYEIFIEIDRIKIFYVIQDAARTLNKRVIVQTLFSNEDFFISAIGSGNEKLDETRISKTFQSTPISTTKHNLNLRAAVWLYLNIFWASQLVCVSRIRLWK